MLACWLAACLLAWRPAAAQCLPVPHPEARATHLPTRAVANFWRSFALCQLGLKLTGQLRPGERQLCATGQPEEEALAKGTMPALQPALPTSTCRLFIVLAEPAMPPPDILRPGAAV
jgi:hypothetical protein